MDKPFSDLYDRRQLRRRFEAAVPGYDDAAVLQRTVADRLLERLDVVRSRPTMILDAGCGTGYATRALTRRYPRARVIGFDLACGMARRARARAGWFARSRFACGEAEHLPFADAAFDMVVSNLMLPWCDPATVFAEFLRALRPSGLLMFTSFGPDTLREMRASWRQVDEAAHVHAFLDMHDVGDALMRTGFADPVMDVEHYTLTYPNVDAVMHDLKALGVQNAQAGRRRGLTGRGRFDRFRSTYAAMAQDGRIPATYEVVHGHAWAPEMKRSRDRTTATIPIDRIRRRR